MQAKNILALLTFVTITLCQTFANPAIAENKKTIDFNRDIKPLLSDRCFACHGPDAAQRKADLRLDIQDKESAVIVAGDADASEIIKRITSTDADEVMPPADSNIKPLTPAQIELIKTWIKQGATYEAHWAYQPITSAKTTSKNPIDKLVTEKLAENKLGMSPALEKRRLIRRVYFDLTGLPPNPSEIEAFVNDTSPNAFEKVVDNLLASEAYGERMAMYWLDQVRYADTNGIHGDNNRDHAPFRDYVINAFNNNMPFDRFTVEQIAGDLIENRTNQQWIASGYNRLNMTTREGGAQAKEYLAKYAADRVRNASVVWLGSTLGCAECHDHKYDPFKTKDFYSFGAFFADIEEVAVGQQQPVRLPGMADEIRTKSLKQEIADQKALLAKRTNELQPQQTAWEAATIKRLEKSKPVWMQLEPTSAETSGDSTLSADSENILISKDGNPAKDDYTIIATPNTKTATGIRLECFTDPSFGNKSLSRANGNFVLNRFEVYIDDKPVKIASAFATYSQGGFPIANAIDGKKETGWAPEGHIKVENRTAVFQFEKPTEIAADAKLKIIMRHESVYSQHNIGKFRLSVTSAEKPNLQTTDQSGQSLLAVLKKPAEKRSAGEKAKLQTAFQKESAELKPLVAKVDSLNREMKAIRALFSEDPCYKDAQTANDASVASRKLAR